MAIQKPHNEFNGGVKCDGIVKRNGWTFVDIDGDTWQVPSWKCDKCGAEFWSYFDNDNGDEGYNMDDPPEDYENYPF